MRIITKTAVKNYIDHNPQSKSALSEWMYKTEEAEWQSFADIKNTFNSVDYVGNQHYVFNIKGNDYRLVVVIQFTPQYVYIRFIGTHAEYDRIKDIKNI
ncbi:MAG: type II toxin-antitoxin system HigB family toxin [Bacteroidales bacterium]|nr:type II toxin-antitoxin system HigB family toxin [Bacteroidales bacterium]